MIGVTIPRALISSTLLLCLLYSTRLLPIYAILAAYCDSSDDLSWRRRAVFLIDGERFTLVQQFKHLKKVCTGDSAAVPPLYVTDRFYRCRYTA